MRFFKAFTLLHRRSKSATFVPGPTGQPEFVPVSPKPKSPSVSGETGPARNSGLSFFDLVTSNPPLVPPSYFTYTTEDGLDRVRDVWPSRRHSDKGVLSTFQSSIRKECNRLAEAVNFWITEYTKVQNLLKSCHAELLVERLKTGSLEARIKADALEIERLRSSLDSYAKSNTEDLDLDPMCPPVVLPSQTSDMNLYPQPKSPTPDQYASALQMILTKRKELRDQMKISKYWKGQAITLGEQDMITPSVSAISSIREVLPSGRQLAVKALMSQRGITVRLPGLPLEDAALGGSNTTSFQHSEVSQKSIPERASINLLPYANSGSSDLSRLEPLASESLKQEINMLFGPSSPSKRLFASRSRQIGPLITSKSGSTKTGLSALSRYSHSFESFGDINTLFQKAFGTGQGRTQQAVKQLETCQESDSIATSDIEQLSLLDLVGAKMLELSDIPAVNMLESSIPSGCSQTWVNVESIDPEFVIPDFTLPLDAARVDEVKEPSTEDTRHSTPKSPSKRSPLKEMLLRRSEKENDGSSLSLSLFKSKKKQSRLPIPTAAKKEA
ncbi:hypothetical protein CPC08DRAFT_703178 [Agrocybe pediades]|nr:hypothetical protein CPC08DRAFT_703178 [Agrocybe pediades]